MERITGLILLKFGALPFKGFGPRGTTAENNPPMYRADICEHTAQRTGLPPSQRLQESKTGLSTVAVHTGGGGFPASLPAVLDSLTEEFCCPSAL